MPADGSSAANVALPSPVPARIRVSVPAVFAPAHRERIALAVPAGDAGAPVVLRHDLLVLFGRGSEPKALLRGRDVGESRIEIVHHDAEIGWLPVTRSNADQGFLGHDQLRVHTRRRQPHHPRVLRQPRLDADFRGYGLANDAELERGVGGYVYELAPLLAAEPVPHTESGNARHGFVVPYVNGGLVAGASRSRRPAVETRERRIAGIPAASPPACSVRWSMPASDPPPPGRR